MMKASASPAVAVIGDLVASRDQDSRRRVQESLLAALTEVNRRVEGLQPLEPTIGDEVQGVYASLHDALLATVVLRLALPEGMDARCGVGLGEIEIVGSSAYGLTQDGPAWWSARDAVVAVKDRERRQPGLRTWVQRHDEEGPDPVNAYTLCRDELVSALDGRGRRLALGLLDGTTHARLAAAEGVSPSAVSQRVRRDGLAALVESIALVRS